MLPVTDRVELMRSLGNSDAALVILGDPTGSALLAANIAITPSRALPGHRRLRVSRFNASENPAADDQLLRWIADYGREDFRCLSIAIELFEPDALRRARLASTLASIGFARVKWQRSYQTTLALDLTPTADALLAGLHRDTRRDVRAPHKHKMEVRPVNDGVFADRLETMVARAFARTGGDPPRLPWKTIIGVSARNPTLSRISGVFETSIAGTDSLVSFAWGINRGSYTTYEAGAAERRQDLRSLPLGYAAVWDLVMWAKQMSSSWFDFGGVTPGVRATPNDPVGGISAFKRSFCDNIVEVSEEWVLNRRSIRAAFANFLSSVAHVHKPKYRGVL